MNRYNNHKMKELPLVRTKLYIPQGRQQLVPRPRLVARLNEGIERKLTLVSGPAGFGKTTLVSQWLGEIQLPATWIALDEGDNDLKRFLVYLVAALETLPSQTHPAAHEILNAPQLPPADHLMAVLINQLDEIYGEDPPVRRFLLVLDDYHLIHRAAVHRAVGYLLEHLPSAMHLVISTRADPPLPLARLRARGQLNELRTTDLRFNREEAAGFINRVMGFDLNPEVVAALNERTEGWIAGLQMAAVSMRGRQDLSGFVQAFQGSNRYILDYLMEEVLERQPPEVQSFLLRTAVLDRMCAGLCAALISEEADAIKQSQDTLEYLDHANLFVVPMDDRREWYRYHRLFGDLLRKRVQHLHPDLVPVLHSKASRWFERVGLISEAVEHALAAVDQPHAADLIEQGAESLLQRGELATLENWIEQLPLDLVQSRPHLDLYRLMTQTISGHSLETVEPGLERLLQQGDFAAEVWVLQAYRSLFQARFSRAVELASRGQVDLPEGSVFLRNLAQWIIDVCQLNVNDLRQRGEILENLMWKTQATDNRFFQVSTVCQLAEVRMAQGRLSDARGLYQQALETAGGPDGEMLPIAGQAFIGIGHILREWNQLEEARRLIMEGIELLSSWSPFGAIEGYLALATCCLAQGDLPEVEKALQEARRLAQAFDATQIDDRVVDLVSAQIKLRQGDPALMQHYFKQYGIELHPDLDKGGAGFGGEAPEQIDDRMKKYEDLLRTQVLLYEGQPAAALVVLSPLRQYLEANDRLMMLVEVELLCALALQASGDPIAAQETFERALVLAEPGGFVRRFLDEGRLVAGMLREALRVGVCPDYARRLLEALQKELPEARRAEAIDEALSVKEPLSERELEVLRYLNSSLTVPEIAEMLYVADSTVRSHVKSIYSKLNVHRRQEAIQRAQEIGLL